MIIYKAIDWSRYKLFNVISIEKLSTIEFDF